MKTKNKKSKLIPSSSIERTCCPFCSTHTSVYRRGFDWWCVKCRKPFTKNTVKRIAKTSAELEKDLNVFKKNLWYKPNF